MGARYTVWWEDRKTQEREVRTVEEGSLWIEGSTREVAERSIWERKIQQRDCLGRNKEQEGSKEKVDDEGRGSQL